MDKAASLANVTSCVRTNAWEGRSRRRRSRGSFVIVLLRRGHSYMGEESRSTDSKDELGYGRWRDV